MTRASVFSSFFPVLSVFLALAVFSGCASSTARPPRTAADDGIRIYADLLVRAYPAANITLSEEDGGLFATVNAGAAGPEKILFSPWGGCPEAGPDEERDAPLCSSFGQMYPVGAGGRAPERGFDPGRVRNEAFLKALYGADSTGVEQHVVVLDFFGRKLAFSSRHGAAEALARVVKKLAAVVAEDPGATAYILPSGGTFAWRTIKNSPRLSAHSFAVSIDLNIQKGVYWLWHPSADAVDDARKFYPQAVVDAFEAEGFIWGGKWYSFDFMHFEYRPELILQARENPAPMPLRPAARGPERQPKNLDRPRGRG